MLARSLLARRSVTLQLRAYSEPLSGGAADGTLPIRDQLKTALKTAMRARDSNVPIIKSLLADVITLEKSTSPPHVAPDSSIYTVLQKAVLQRKESASQYSAAKRQDLADKEESEAVFINTFLPTQLSSEEIRSTLSRLIESGGLPSGDIKSLGKLMKAFWAEVEKVKADGAEVGRVAKELLMGEKK